MDLLHLPLLPIIQVIVSLVKVVDLIIHYITAIDILVVAQNTM